MLRNHQPQTTEQAASDIVIVFSPTHGSSSFEHPNQPEPQDVQRYKQRSATPRLQENHNTTERYPQDDSQASQTHIPEAKKARTHYQTQISNHNYDEIMKQHDDFHQESKFVDSDIENDSSNNLLKPPHIPPSNNKYFEIPSRRRSNEIYKIKRGHIRSKSAYSFQGNSRKARKVLGINAKEHIPPTLPRKIRKPTFKKTVVVTDNFFPPVHVRPRSEEIAPQVQKYRHYIDESIDLSSLYEENEQHPFPKFDHVIAPVSNDNDKKNNKIHRTHKFIRKSFMGRTNRAKTCDF